MTATKKSMRFLTVLALILAMVLSIASVPASAESAETWYYGSKTQPTLEISGAYLTPQKTMGDSGELTIYANFVPRVAFTQVTYTLQIRNYNGKILKTSSSTSSALAAVPLSVSLYVNSGEKYTISFSARNTSTGASVDAGVVYMYSLKKTQL